MLRLKWYYMVLVLLAAFLCGVRTDHEYKTRTEGTYNAKVSGGSMYPTLNSGDEIKIRVVGADELLRTDWIVEFGYAGEKNIKRLKALEGQVWEGRIVPPGYVAIAGDCRYSTDPGLPPFIPRKDVTGVVVAARYADRFESPEGQKGEIAKDVPPKVPAKQNPVTIDGVRVLRVDKNASTLTDIGILGDLRPFYRTGSLIIEESTAKFYKVIDVGYAPRDGMTRLKTTPDFGSWTNDGRVALLAAGEKPPADIAALFRRIP